MLGAASALSLGLALAPQFGVELFGDRTRNITFYSPFTRSWEFGAGVLVALAGPRLRIAHHHVATTAAVGALAAIAWCSANFDGSTVHPGTGTLLPVLATVLLLVACADPATPVARLLGSRPLHWIGDISYSWYLWHWPLIVFTTLLVTDEPIVLLAVSLASIAPAMVSYRYVEQPLRHGRGIARHGMPRLVALTLGAPVLAALALGGATRAGFWNNDVRALQTGVLPDHAARARDCTSALLGPVWGNSGCTWNDGAAGEWVYLIGDSHADHFSEALITATTELGRPLRIATSNGCPFTGLELQVDGWPTSYTDGCRAMNTELPAWLEQQAPGTVVIANSNGYWEAPSHAVITAPASDAPASGAAVSAAAGGLPTNDTTTKLAAYRDATIALVEQLERAGHQVVLVHTVPFWADERSWEPRHCSVLDITGGHCSQRTPLGDTLDQYPLARQALADAAAATGATLLEPRNRLCADGICTTDRDGVALYRDTTHLSVVGSTLVAPMFTAALTGP